MNMMALEKVEDAREVISQRFPYRFMSLEELLNPLLSDLENLPIRVLGRIEAFVRVQDLEALHQLIKEEKGMSGYVFYHDL